MTAILGAKVDDWKRSEVLAGQPGVRFGSKADIVPCPLDVRFTPNSGHVSERVDVRIVP